MMPPNFANLDPNLLKQQSQMLGGMSDEQLKAQMDRAKQFMPGMAGMNLSPEMIRQATQAMNNMSPDQIDQMKRMAAQQQFGAGAPNMGGMPNNQANNAGGFTNNTQQQQKWGDNSQPQSKASSSIKELNEANKLKEEANQFYKEQKYEKACERYYESINSIRFNDSLKNNAEARQVEIACRLNVALCKQNLNEYNVVIDQCEQILEYEPKNWKASFRISNAMYLQAKQNKSNGGTINNIRAIHNYAKKALDGNPKDQKIMDFYSEVKVKYDEYVEKQKEEEQKESQEENKQEIQTNDSEQINTSIPSTTSTQSQPPIQLSNPLANLPEEEKINLIKQGTERLNSMDDQQLKNMVDAMKNNKEQMKQMYRGQGMEMSDQQLEMMTNMMSPEMLKNASQMMASNPDLMKNVSQQMKNSNVQQTSTNNSSSQPSQQTKTNPVEEQKERQPEEQKQNSQQLQQPNPQQNQQPFNPIMMNAFGGANNGGDMMGMMNNMMSNPMVQQMMQNPDMMRQAAQMMSGGQGGAPGSLDPNAMQNMMQNPSMKNLLGNPDMINSALSMMKDPAMMNMMKQQNPNLNVDMMVKALDVLAKCASAYRTVKSAWSNVFVRLAVFGILVIIISYYFG